MSDLKNIPDKIITTYLHLPTLIVLAVVSWLLVWNLYEADFSWGSEYIRLNTNQGQIGLYWHHGCCDIDW